MWRREAGLTHPTVYGGVDAKSYIVEVVGCGVAFLDYDNDGWLDVFVLSGTRLDAAPPEATNRLYRNNRDGTFTDVTEKAGLARSGWGSAVTVGDYDNDGFDDLFVTCYGQNVLYRNNGDGTFSDVTAKAGLRQDAARYGSGCTWVDYDRDGQPGSVRRDVPRYDAREAAAPRAERGLPLERRPGQLRPSRPAAGVRAALSQQRRRHVHGCHEAIGPCGGVRLLSDDRRRRRLRQRRMARHLRRLRLDAELAVPQPARRHVSAGRPGARRRVERRRAGAGRHGHRGRRLRPRWQPGHLQDALRRRYQRPLSQRRQGLLQRQHHPRGHRRRDTLRRLGRGHDRSGQRRPSRPVRRHRRRLPGGRAVAAGLSLPHAAAGVPEPGRRAVRGADRGGRPRAWRRRTPAVAAPSATSTTTATSTSS